MKGMDRQRERGRKRRKDRRRAEREREIEYTECSTQALTRLIRTGDDLILCHEDHSFLMTAVRTWPCFFTVLLPTSSHFSFQPNKYLQGIYTFFFTSQEQVVKFTVHDTYVCSKKDTCSNGNQEDVGVALVHKAHIQKVATTTPTQPSLHKQLLHKLQLAEISTAGAILYVYFVYQCNSYILLLSINHFVNIACGFYALKFSSREVLFQCLIF